jgi:hypothetical protein
MRTIIIVVIGLVVWAACLGVAKLTHGVTAASSTAATIVFTVIWFVAAAVNMWIGVSQAGYSFSEELPIFLVIFLLPVVVAVVVKWKFLG